MVDDKAGLRFRIKADGKEAISELNKIKGSVKDVGSIASGAARGDIGALASAFKGLGDEGNKATTYIKGAGLAVAAMAGAAVGLGAALFALAKNASDYGSAIFEASEKTGFSAETLTSLKMVAEQAGSSFEEVSGALTKFNKLAGEAATGSKSAAKSLAELGLGPKDAVNDLEGSLAKVVKTIYELPSGALQTEAAMKAFGRSGANLIPVIKAANGDMGELIKKAKELGVTMTDAEARMSEDFGDALTQLKQQFQGLTFQIGSGMMPVFRGLMLDMSKYLSENKEKARQFGQTAATALGNTLKAAMELAAFVAKHPTIFGAGAGAALGGMIGGPWGAAVGAVAGAVGGTALAYETPTQRTQRRILAGEDPNAVVGEEKRTVAGQTAYSGLQFDPKSLSFDKTKLSARQMRNIGGMYDTANKALAEIDIAAQEAAAAIIATGEAVDLTGQSVGGNFKAGSAGASQKLQDAMRAVQIAGDDLRDQVTTKVAAFQQALSRSIDPNIIGANVTNAKDDLAELYTALEENLAAEEKLKLGEAKTEQEKLNIRAEYNLKRRQMAHEQKATIERIEETAASRSVELTRSRLQNELETLKSNNSKIDAELEQALKDREITESEYLNRKLDLKKAEIAKEIELQKAIKDDQNTNFLEREEAIKRIAALENQLGIEILQTEGAIAAAYAKSAEARAEIQKATQAAIDEMALSQAEAAVAAAERDLRLKADTLFQIDKLITAEKALAQLRYDQRIAQLAEDEKAEIARVKTFENEQELITAIVKKYAELRRQALQDLNQASGAADTKGADAKEGAKGGFMTGFFGKDGMRDFDDGASYIEGRVGAMKEMLGQAFSQMAQGVGGLIEQWVLYGELGPNALRKMTAAVLANLAAQAAVEAIMETARGFAKLANPFTAWQAPFHFASAKMFAVVAGVAAVAGRVIAGNSFKNESGRAQTSNQSNTSGTRQGSSGGDGGTINIGRNASSGFAPRAEIVIRDKSGMFGTLFAAELESNSRVRQLIIDTANS
jgi:hypothetical protein